MDDDIVFLGTSRPAAMLPNTRPAVRPVTGITLHVESNGPVSSHSLTFSRSATAVVHVGRRSASEITGDESSSSDNTASFRCAVVSRRHAKIAFSDSGHAYLIDLGSHHGTHVRSPADRTARALVPETPTLLVDGDFVTFGKAVGKGDEAVKPIVVRVELLHTPVSTKSTDVSVTSSSGPNTPADIHPTMSPISPGRPSTGRYGIHVGDSHSSSSSSSSSSDAEGESMEHDSFSDIEEIPPPASRSLSQLQAQFFSQNQLQSQPQVQEVQYQSRPQNASQSASPTPAWLKPTPHILGRVVSTIRELAPRNVVLRDDTSSSWPWSMAAPTNTIHDRQQQQRPPDESGQDEPVSERDQARENMLNSRLLERQELLRDALGRRRAQLEQEKSTARPSETIHAPAPTGVGTAATTACSELPANNATTSAPTLSSPASNRLPPMLGFSGLSQLFGLGTDKRKQSTSSGLTAEADTTKSVDAEPSTNAEVQVSEPAASENVDSNKDAQTAAPGLQVEIQPTKPIEVCGGWTYVRDPSPPPAAWAVPAPGPRPVPNNAALPSLASALSQGHGNCYVHAHGQMRRILPNWSVPPSIAPAIGAFAPTAPVPALPAMYSPTHAGAPPPTHSPASAEAWNWNDSWWDTFPVGPPAASAGVSDPAHTEHQRRTADREMDTSVQQATASSCGVDHPRFDFMHPDVDSRGAAQSPPPPVLPAPASPGLSYASSRESSPASSDAGGQKDKANDNQDREMSEPMELASRSVSPMPLQKVDKGKRRVIESPFSPSEDESDGNEEGERGMDIQDDPPANSFSQIDANLTSASVKLLTLLRDKAAAREVQITREQERERQVEQERQKEWAVAVEKRERDRREMERECQRQATLMRVQQAVKKLETDFALFRGQANLQLMEHTKKLSAFDGRIGEVDAECGVLCVRVEGLGERLEVAQIDVASINTTLDNMLESGLSGSGNGAREGEDDAMADSDAVRMGVSDVRALLEEIKALRASTQLQAEEELRALRTLRAEAEVACAALTQQMQVQVQAQVQPQPPVLPSLKRKRDDSDEDEAALDGDDERAETVNVNENGNQPELERDDDVVMDAPPLPLATSASTSESESSSSLPTLHSSTIEQAPRDMLPPPRKRARKIARLVARTATAVSVGAVVTWTALAFS